MENLTFKFPDNFLWGAATSGPQSEGRFNKRHKNIFDYWFDKEPEAFFNMVGPNIASNFYNDYRKDIKMMKSIGLNSFRTSIQWTRLIKNFETGELDPDGVEYYNNLIDELISKDITPIMNLHHFDIPFELYNKYGGWESKHVIDLFEVFAKKCFQLFGDRVKYWTTFNEPMVIAEGEYLYKFQYPNIVDGKKAVQVIYNLNLASAKAVKAFRNTECFLNGGKIGIILNLTPAYPKSQNEEDKKASEFVEDFYNNSFLNTSIKGNFPEKLVELLRKDNVIWNSTTEEMNIIKNNTVDFLGVNYYRPMRVKARITKLNESNGWMPDKYFESYKMPDAKMNMDRGWEIYPKGIYDIAINIKNNYNNIPWYISENGIGIQGEEKYLDRDGIIEDDYRIDFYKEHLKYLYKAIQEGANCFGYHTWTLIDCWSWKNAYKNRYGLISLNLKTQKRTIKKSGLWIKNVCENNGF